MIKRCMKENKKKMKNMQYRNLKIFSSDHKNIVHTGIKVDLRKD